MSKPTLATLKSFIKKNGASLFIQKKSDFDGMVDGVVYNRDAKFVPVELNAPHVENTLGVKGVWVVRGSRDHITPFKQGNFEGFSVDNCCGSFVLAKKVV